MSATPDGPRVAVVDYGAGNLVSIEQALLSVGARPERATGPGDLEGADLVVVPGVGAAAPAMERLHAQGLVDPVRRWIEADRPFLGICLGLQLLFDGSDEDGATTLGVLPGRTRRLADAPTLPHIGWNQVERLRAHPAFEGIAPRADFYFVHSYAGRSMAPTRSRSPRRPTVAPSCRRSPADGCSACSSILSAAAPTGSDCSATSSGTCRQTSR
jgi:imidazole glycerol phosphate synthase glutamine amidotransferase subunit